MCFNRSLAEFDSEVNNGLFKKGMNFDEIPCTSLRQLKRLLVVYILRSVIFVALIVACGPVKLH